MQAKNTLPNDPAAPGFAVSGNGERQDRRFHLLVSQDEDGVFSAVVLNLPGVGSCGDSAEEAVENAKEAIAGALESFEADHEAIPWRDSASIDIPAEAQEKWITLHG